MVAMTRRQRGGPDSGHMILGIAQVMFVGLATMILAVSSSAATPTPQGSITAQLLHREHALSPLRSPDYIGQAEKLRNEVLRSAARSRNLLHRSPKRTSTIEASVNDASPGEYLMTVSLGTPSQNFIAIADTGSDLTWLQCSPCADCFNQSDPVYFPSLSSTYSELSCSSSGCQNFSSQNALLDVTTCDSSTSCPYDYTYGTGFTVGNLSSESVTLRSVSGKNVTIPDFWFGCSHNSSDDFEPADGLVGLGQGIVSFPSQLGHVFEDKFAYCLVNKSVAAVQSSLLVFGHDAVSAPIGEKLQHTPILKNDIPPFNTYYYVGLEAIFVNGVALNFSATDVAIDSEGNGGTIFDSGTTITSLTPLLFYQLLASVVAKVPKDFQTVDLSAETGLELCYDVTGNVDYANVFPSISFKFEEGGAWNLPFDNSWSVQSEFEAVCLAFSRGDTGDSNIFGNIQQQDFYVQYDRVHRRIGYAATDCGSMAP